MKAYKQNGKIYKYDYTQLNIALKPKDAWIKDRLEDLAVKYNTSVSRAAIILLAKELE